MQVFVTGGTGLLGNTVIRQLRERGDRVVALVRSQPASEIFEGLDVELAWGELESPSAPDAESSDENESDKRDSASNAVSSQETPEPWDELDKAIQQCDAVIHSAALIHIGWTQMDQSMNVNRDGTRRIAELCLKHKKKLVLVGTVDTIALASPTTIADETTPLGHNGGQVECAYVLSKRAAVQAVKSMVPAGLEVVIVHPGFMLGPWDWKPSSGRMMLELSKGWKPLSPSGGCSLCDSRDVARGVLSALDGDVPSGREFVLAGHNMTYFELWTEMARRMGNRGPMRPAGPGLQFIAGAAGDLFAKVSGKEGDLNSAGVQMSAQYHWYDSKRAQTELGYQNRDAKETLDDCAEWIRSRFVLPAKPPED